MPTEYFIIELFCRVDDKMIDVHKHTQAALFIPAKSSRWHCCLPSKAVVIGPSSAGCAIIDCTCFRAYTIVAACFACITHIGTDSWLPSA